MVIISAMLFALGTRDRLHLSGLRALEIIRRASVIRNMVIQCFATQVPFSGRRYFLHQLQFRLSAGNNLTVSGGKIDFTGSVQRNEIDGNTAAGCSLGNARSSLRQNSKVNLNRFKVLSLRAFEGNFTSAKGNLCVEWMGNFLARYFHRLSIKNRTASLLLRIGIYGGLCLVIFKVYFFKD